MRGCAILLLAVSLAVSGSELTDAAASGDIERVHALVAAGADCNHTPPNDKPKFGYLVRTPVEAAAWSGHPDIVKALLDCGAQLRQDRWMGMYAATHAARRQHTEVLRVLLASFTPDGPPEPWYGPALISSALHGNTAAVQLLLGAGVNPDWHTDGDHFPRPALTEAGRGQKFDLYPLLLEAGADPDGSKAHGPGGPLFAAAGARRADLVKLLLDRGADPEPRSDFGNAISVASQAVGPESPAAKARAVATIRLLLERDVSPNVPIHGRTPLWYAQKAENEELAAMLEQAGGVARETVGRRIRRFVMSIIFGVAGH